MRLGGKAGDAGISDINGLIDRIQARFATRMKEYVEQVPVKVMLRDSTVTEQVTFDPARVQGYFNDIVCGLDGWSIHGPVITNNEDTRRIFAKFDTKIGNYMILGHVSVQFHVLLYYRLDQRVVDAQKELAKVLDGTAAAKKSLADKADRIVSDRLKEAGHADLDADELFKVIYEDDELRERVYSEILDSADADTEKNANRERDLLDELNGLLMETYQTSHVMIDDARLVTGEEGFLCTFDLEFVRKGAREGRFDTRRIPENTRSDIMTKLAEFEALIG